MEKCRLFFYFLNPCDGGVPEPGIRGLHWRIGGALEDITVLGAGEHAYEPLDVPGHWRGYIHEGRVYRASDRPEDDETTNPMVPTIKDDA